MHLPNTSPWPTSTPYALLVSTPAWEPWPTARGLVEAFGIDADIAAELPTVLGDNPEPTHSKAAFTRLCGTNPIPTPSGKTTRHRLNQDRHRHARPARYHTVIVGMQYHEPTMAYTAYRTGEGKTTPEIIRCLKHFLAHEA